MFVISGAKIEGYARSGRWDIQSRTAETHHEPAAAGAGSVPALTSLAKRESLEEYRMRVREDRERPATPSESHTGRRPTAFAYPFGADGADRSNDPAIIDVLRDEVAREYKVAFQQDDQDTVPVITADQDHLLLRRVEVQDWSGLQLLQRIERAARPGPWEGVVAPAPEELALPVGPLLPARRANAPPTSTTLPRAAATPATGSGRAPARPLNAVLPNVTVPPVSVPPVAVTPPPLNVTVPPVTVPPLPVVTTAPPTTTRPPATTTTTRPPTTTTTACKPVGKSGKCAGA